MNHIKTMELKDRDTKYWFLGIKEDTKSKKDNGL